MSATELTPEQRRAVESRDRDVFLQAGAGTGKTTVLVERLRATAIDDGVGLDGVLAFTFTERAADQLRDRVRELLGEQTLEGDWISTIHGFCRRLLSNHPAAAGIDPRYRVVDQAEADRLSNRAFTEAVRELLLTEDLDAAELVASHHRRPLRDAVRGAHEELRSRGEERPALPQPEASDLGGALTGLAAAAGVALPECEEAGGGDSAAESCERMRRAASLGPGSTPSLAQLQGLEVISGGKAFKGEATEGYKSALRQARRAVAERELAGQYAALRRLVELYGDRYGSLKEGRSGLDFEDLQIRARDLLRDNEPIADRLPRAVSRSSWWTSSRTRTAAATADRTAAGTGHAAVRGRRRVPVHLRLPSRRPRGLPAPAAPLRSEEPQQAAAAADAATSARPPSVLAPPTRSAARCWPDSTADRRAGTRGGEGAARPSSCC